MSPGPSEGKLTMSQEEKKRIVQAFYHMVLNEMDVDTAFELYAGNYYRQHNTMF